MRLSDCLRNLFFCLVTTIVFLSGMQEKKDEFPCKILPTQFPVSWLKFSENGKKLTAVDSKENILVWNFENGNNSKLEPSEQRQNWIERMEVWLSDQATIKCAYVSSQQVPYHYQIYVWDCLKGTHIMLEGHYAPVLAVAFSVDGEKLASCSSDGKIIIWNLKTGGIEKKFMGAVVTYSDFSQKRKYAYDLAFNPDNKSIAGGFSDGSVVVWDIVSGKEVKTLRGHTGLVYSVAWSPDGAYLASASKDQKILIWDLQCGKVVAKLEGHTDTVLSVVFDKGGFSLASGAADKTVRVWDLSKLKNIK